MRMMNASASLEQLVAESGWLRRLAVALVKDEAAADDLVQDTYSIAATQAPTDGRPLRPWLARVLWNRVRMASRSARRRRAREEAFGELATAPARPRRDRGSHRGSAHAGRVGARARRSAARRVVAPLLRGPDVEPDRAAVGDLGR